MALDAVLRCSISNLAQVALASKYSCFDKGGVAEFWDLLFQGKGVENVSCKERCKGLSNKCFPLLVMFTYPENISGNPHKLN